MLSLTAWGRQGCCHSLSPDPTDNEAEKLLPAGTGHIQRYLAMQVIDRHPGHSQSTGSPPSPVLLSSVPGQDSRASLGAQDHTQGASSQQWGWFISPAEGTCPFELPRMQSHSSCWHNRFTAGRYGHTQRVRNPLLESTWRWTLISREGDSDDQVQDRDRQLHWSGLAFVLMDPLAPFFFLKLQKSFPFSHLWVLP